MNNWISKNIGELCDIGGGKVKTGPFGSQLHQSDYSEQGTPVVMPTDIFDNGINEKKIARVSQNHVDRLVKHQLKKGDIIYGRRGDIGRQALIKDENLGWLCGTGCLRITLGDSEVIPEFLHLYLKMNEIIRWIQNQAIGATMPNLNTQILRRVPIIYPRSKETQKEIVSLILAYDDLIETNNQRIATLEAIAQQIYKEWFVRLRFPNWEHTPFHHGIPDGWEVKNFDTFCTLQRGYDLPDQDIKDGIYPVIASTSIKAYHNEYKVKPPVITTGRSGSLGAVIFSHQKSWVLNTALYVKNFHNNSPYLIFYTLKNLKLENFNAGAGVPSLNRNHLQAIKINVPPKEIQNQFDKIISDIFNQKVILEESNAILQKNRNLLLPRLISGKLTLKQAEAQAI